ncbi:LrgB family protein [Terasakiella sp. A23]|uniref:LrgB family protein n=1 Tax=Terasakiella sp. FCG-A23 TaxID=3080561 RepID=UPI00295458EE|nr:LrgB family protein [Terasakiella sp. A23]MDV7338985.1 LrgB family protein [Terasakiella sp. A23]
MNTLLDLWNHLTQTPLLGIGLTLGCFCIGDWIYRTCKQSPLANPVLISIILVSGVLWITKTDYQVYFDGAKYIHFLLGPATVALAVPLYKNLHHIRSAFFPILATVTLGGLFAIISGVYITYALGGSETTVLSMVPKSVTAPVAMGLSEIIGGTPSLTAVLVILSGVVGAVFGGMVLSLFRVQDKKARGLAVGIASHGIGTARKLSINETAGAFAGLGMGLNALVTALLLPILILFLT